MLRCTGAESLPVALKSLSADQPAGNAGSDTSRVMTDMMIDVVYLVFDTNN